MGSDESRFNVSLTVRGKFTRQRPQTPTFWRETRAEARTKATPSAYQTDSHVSDPLPFSHLSVGFRGYDVSSYGRDLRKGALQEWLLDHAPSLSATVGYIIGEEGRWRGGGGGKGRGAKTAESEGRWEMLRAVWTFHHSSVPLATWRLHL